MNFYHIFGGNNKTHDFMILLSNQDFDANTWKDLQYTIHESPMGQSCQPKPKEEFNFTSKQSQ